MIALLLTLLIVVPTLFIAPYSPYIIVPLVIFYLATRSRKAGNLRSIRKLVEKKGEEIEDKSEIEIKRDKDEIKIKREYESNFIESTTDIIFYILLGFVLSTFILHLFWDVPPLIDKVLLLTMVLCLITVYFMYWRSPHNEDKRKWQKHYRDFCENYMNDRYQEFLREEQERKKEEG